MIKAVAIDIVGVIVKENDYVLDTLEQLLERKFGVINTDENFLKWAQQQTKLPKVAIEKKVQHIIENIYDIREAEMFAKLPKLKFSTATNHLSYLDEWFKSLPIAKNFDYFVNSAIVGAQKPEKEFYEIVIKTLGEQPENILFIDDNEENCKAAELARLNTVHYNRSGKLSDKILEKLISQPGF